MSDHALDEFYEALLADDAEALYDRAPCGYLSTAPDGTIIKVNQTFLTLTGYERDDLEGHRTFAQLLTGGGRIYHETHHDPMLQMHGAVRGLAVDLVRADGSRLAALVNSVLERDPVGDPLVVRIAVFDATERRRYEQELVGAKRRAEASEAKATELARTLQQTLMPPVLPDIPGLGLSAAYRAAGNGEEVGGDFYDVFQLRSGDWIVAVGDVEGKGVGAAVITALARHTIRAAAVRDPRPSQILATLNEVVVLHDAERFCTAAIVRLHESDDEWCATTSLGGHPHPLLARAGRAPVGLGEQGPLIGAFETSRFEDIEDTLQPGDTVLLFTDGVTEGQQGREFYGDERLTAAVVAQQGSATALAEAILDDVLQFQAQDPRDDIVAVSVRVLAP